MDSRVFPRLLVLLFLPLCSCQTYYLSDKAGLGRVFDGIGGLSGGGVSAASTSGFGKAPKTLKVNVVSAGCFRQPLGY